MEFNDEAIFASLLLSVLIPLVLYVVYYVFNDQLGEVYIMMLFEFLLFMAARYMWMAFGQYTAGHIGAPRIVNGVNSNVTGMGM
jgi:hypothetical protein